VELLIQAGADTEASGRFSRMALAVWADNGKHVRLRRFLQNIPDHHFDLEPLQLAHMLDHPEIIGLIETAMIHPQTRQNRITHF
jgi:hypothetical protein